VTTIFDKQALKEGLHLLGDENGFGGFFMREVRGGRSTLSSGNEQGRLLIRRTFATPPNYAADAEKLAPKDGAGLLFGGFQRPQPPPARKSDGRKPLHAIIRARTPARANVYVGASLAPPLIGTTGARPCPAPPAPILVTERRFMPWTKKAISTPG
jgi:hypothetical protein